MSSNKLREHCREVARCDLARQVLDGPLQNTTAEALSCAPLISAQLKAARRTIQTGSLPWLIPEPWNGDLKNAEILFIGQNPAASHAEHYPDETWVNDDDVYRFFSERFGEEADLAPISFGTKVRLKDNGYAVANPFLGRVFEIATKILGRLPTPGVHYAITEAVRCKVTKATGIDGALVNCATRYLCTTLALSRAKIVVCLGTRAHLAFELAVLGDDLKIARSAEEARQQAELSIKARPKAKAFDWGDKKIAVITHPGAFGRAGMHPVPAWVAELGKFVDSSSRH